MTPHELMKFARQAEAAGVEQITFGTQVRLEGDDLGPLAGALMDLSGSGTILLNGVKYRYELERDQASPSSMVKIIIGDPVEEEAEERPTPRLDHLMSTPAPWEKEA